MDLESYEEVLDFLDDYFTVRIKDEKYLNEMREVINGSRKKKTVTIRPIQLLFLEYRMKFNDYSIVSKDEKKLWIDLLDYWQ
ncbi:hypothetical protein [Mixta calida]|uniref:hypothetical protein n=1 Tax=Mixta calida TaxID=665913 RepID=UPI00290EC911|nr:hypothetical protein [Mixta calida]MDU6537343.1 hypothetical protein [Mixta calida]